MCYRRPCANRDTNSTLPLLIRNLWHSCFILSRLVKLILRFACSILDTMYCSGTDNITANALSQVYCSAIGFIVRVKFHKSVIKCYITLSYKGLIILSLRHKKRISILFPVYAECKPVSLIWCIIFD